MNREETEKEIIAKGLTAPRITKDRIEGLVKSTEYHTFPDSLLTTCCLILENGFTVTGESSCVSPENFDKDLGEKRALEKAVDKIYELEAYLLKQRLFEGYK